MHDKPTFVKIPNQHSFIQFQGTSNDAGNRSKANAEKSERTILKAKRSPALSKSKPSMPILDVKSKTAVKKSETFPKSKSRVEYEELFSTQEIVKFMPDPPPLTQGTLNDSFFATQTVDLCSFFGQKRSKSCTSRDKPRTVKSTPAVWTSTREKDNLKKSVDRRRTFSYVSPKPAKAGRSGKSVFDI
uniref:Uncharacterized protein n=1 Tax=Panagrolaimus sp. JU765 TaxID=591449 RepID=A0AC34QZE3_9BILA